MILFKFAIDLNPLTGNRINAFGIRIAYSIAEKAYLLIPGLVQLYHLIEKS